MTESKAGRSFKIELEPIRAVEFVDSDRVVAQKQAMYSATRRTERHFERYRELAADKPGEYVNADLFKRTFPLYNSNPTYYDCPVHNSAAVLSTAYFAAVVHDKDRRSSDHVVFLTGVPGAGKSSLLAMIEVGSKRKGKDARLPVIYEVSMASFDAAKKKIDIALEAGLKPEIMVVHTTAEQALDNTLLRFSAIGRGCRLDVMADIMGEMPESLKKIHDAYPDIPLTICDKRGRDDRVAGPPLIYKGWEHLDILRSEGTSEEIRERLYQRLARRCAKGEVSENGFR